MIQQLLATGAMHPQTPLNPCTTFTLCLPMSGIELPVCSVEVCYALDRVQLKLQLVATYVFIVKPNGKFECALSTNIITHDR